MKIIRLEAKSLSFAVIDFLYFSFLLCPDTLFDIRPKILFFSFSSSSFSPFTIIDVMLCLAASCFLFVQKIFVNRKSVSPFRCQFLFNFYLVRRTAKFFFIRFLPFHFACFTFFRFCWVPSQTKELQHLSLLSIR